ncbi:hypothetical protein WMY93_028036 [Mugilogobius chulae]|uniref:Uncharacterized protein n=1 Tax=Mugilogobius chulae TaxID=88201 RepID=A0AAW0N505_9GOBI
MKGGREDGAGEKEEKSKRGKTGHGTEEVVRVEGLLAWREFMSPWTIQERREGEVRGGEGMRRNNGRERCGLVAVDNTLMRDKEREGEKGEGQSQTKDKYFN